MFVFSVGEIIYSPRISAYCLELAPHGREATYAAISDIPTFASKIFAGGLAGEFLEKYMAKDHPESHRGTYMWFLLGCISVVSPVLLIAVYPFYKNMEKGTPKEPLLDQTTSEEQRLKDTDHEERLFKSDSEVEKTRRDSAQIHGSTESGGSTGRVEVQSKNKVPPSDLP